MVRSSSPAWTPEQRRARLVRRHGVGLPLALDPADLTRRLVALHATDPATVYLSLLARNHSLTLEDVSHALYEQRSVIRLLAMRRTLFVFPREQAHSIQVGTASGVARTQRRGLERQLATLPTEPQVDQTSSAVTTLVDELIDRVAALVEEHGPLSGSELSALEPRLRTAFLPTSEKPWDQRRNLTSSLLTLAGLEGAVVRARPGGGWTSRAHRWESARLWIDAVDVDPLTAQTELLRRYLDAFGPVTMTDLTWWTGWSQTVVRKALAALELTEAADGLVLLAGTEPEAPLDGEHVALLPALDPTPMGWKQRDWFLPDDPSGLYDRFGNIGPTIWCNGHVIGAWAVDSTGKVKHRLIGSVSGAVNDAVRAEANRLTDAIGGTAVVPSFPTPWERELRQA